MPEPYVLVFVMEGCGACAEFLPRFKKLIGDKKHYVVDVDKHEKHADFYKVMATPTMVLVDRPRGPWNQITGSTTDAEISRFLSRIPATASR